MTDELQIRTAQLGVLAEALDKAAVAIDEEAAGVRDASSLMLDGWEGDAAEAFRVRESQILHEMHTRRDSLTACAVLASQIESVYARADVDLARIFGDG